MQAQARAEVDLALLCRAAGSFHAHGPAAATQILVWSSRIPVKRHQTHRIMCTLKCVELVDDDTIGGLKALFEISESARELFFVYSGESEGYSG